MTLYPRLLVNVNGRTFVWRFREEFQLRAYELILKRREIQFREQWAALPDRALFTTETEIARDLASSRI